MSGVKRYAHIFPPYLNARKITNALLAHTEMTLGSAKLKSKPYILRLETTNVCNLHCPGCATGLGINPYPPTFFQPQVLADLLDVISQELLLVRFDGLGEPLLHPEICQMISIAHRAGIATMLSSNFSLSLVRNGTLEDLISSGLDHLIVSIDGPTQETYQKYRRGGNLDQVLENVRNLVALRMARKSRKPFIEIQFIGFDYTRTEAVNMPPLAKQLGVDRLTLKMMDEKVRQERFAKDFIGQRCFYLYNTTTIACDGRLLLCPNGFIDQPKLPNIEKQGINSLSNNHSLQIAVRAFLASSRETSYISCELGNPVDKNIPWRTPRGPSNCRCLSCAGPGMCADRNKAWFDNYVCT